jgi:hypothetical protein
MEGRLIKRMNQQQFYDKMISRMDKMSASLDKISRNIEAISKSIDTKNEYPVYTVTGALKSIDMTHLEAKDSSDQYGNITINE